MRPLQQDQDSLARSARIRSHCRARRSCDGPRRLPYRQPVPNFENSSG